ncbi:hypothetical protein RRG08_020659 [Elysia crispata]|uniref:Uncharacterized protein n=1 Tax=Elysia crispata TaxID=231223 RepID=A0AAE0Z4N2_9GAST|nr:hypothetical protein RRG08_020659 [Elysia crispata]
MWPCLFILAQERGRLYKQPEQELPPIRQNTQFPAHFSRDDVFCYSSSSPLSNPCIVSCSSISRPLWLFMTDKDPVTTSSWSLPSLRPCYCLSSLDSSIMPGKSVTHRVTSPSPPSPVGYFPLNILHPMSSCPPHTLMTTCTVIYFAFPPFRFTAYYPQIQFCTLAKPALSLRRYKARVKWIRRRLSPDTGKSERPVHPARRSLSAEAIRDSQSVIWTICGWEDLPTRGDVTEISWISPALSGLVGNTGFRESS